MARRPVRMTRAQRMALQGATGLVLVVGWGLVLWGVLAMYGFLFFVRGPPLFAEDPAAYFERLQRIQQSLMFWGVFVVALGGVLYRLAFLHPLSERVHVPVAAASGGALALEGEDAFVVRVQCRLCGALNEDADPYCVDCGARV